LKTSDSGATLEQATNASRATNGNVAVAYINGLATRLQAFVFLQRVLLDQTDTNPTASIVFTWRRRSGMEPLFKPDGSPYMLPNGTQKQGYIPTTHNINVPLTWQRP
jgi:hypothetical protein